MICAAIITAGGRGVRMGGDRPKQYLEVGGLPILARTIAAYERHPLVDYIVVTVPQIDESYCQINIIEKFKFKKVLKVTKGGSTRQESVFNGLKFAQDSDLVAIHDGVRPFVSPLVISSAFGVAGEVGACIAALPVSETVKQKTGNLLKTIPRDDLWLARTPQVFKTDFITNAHAHASKENIEVTDDAALIETMGRKIGIIQDTFFNIKITSRDDLLMAELIAKLPEFSLGPDS